MQSQAKKESLAAEESSKPTDDGDGDSALALLQKQVKQLGEQVGLLTDRHDDAIEDQGNFQMAATTLLERLQMSYEEVIDRIGELRRRKKTRHPEFAELIGTVEVRAFARICPALFNPGTISFSWRLTQVLCAPEFFERISQKMRSRTRTAMITCPRTMKLLWRMSSGSSSSSVGVILNCLCGLRCAE